MITPMRDLEMTTSQAAEFLHVSRRFLLGLLESGRISYRLDDGHHRLHVADVLAFKERSDRSVRRMALVRAARLLWGLSAWCNRSGNSAFMLAHPDRDEARAKNLKKESK